MRRCTVRHMAGASKSLLGGRAGLECGLPVTQQAQARRRAAEAMGWSRARMHGKICMLGMWFMRAWVSLNAHHLYLRWCVCACGVGWLP